MLEIVAEATVVLKELLEPLLDTALVNVFIANDELRVQGLLDPPLETPVLEVETIVDGVCRLEDLEIKVVVAADEEAVIIALDCG